MCISSEGREGIGFLAAEVIGACKPPGLSAGLLWVNLSLCVIALALLNEKFYSEETIL